MSRGEGEGMDQGTVSLKIRLATIQMKIIVYGDFRLGFFFIGYTEGSSILA